MITSDYPSTVVLPEEEKTCPTLLDFLSQRFPKISRKTWEERMFEGKITDRDGLVILNNIPYAPGMMIRYYREVAAEPLIPFEEDILFSNEHIMVVCKPHFLPVIPSGPYVNECLLNRLKKNTGNPHLSPVNRIDRETAGLVVFSLNPETRGLYQSLFMDTQVEKHYEAVTHCFDNPINKNWIVENRLEQGEPFFLMKETKGHPNAVSRIRCVKTGKKTALFHITPVTGKKHQIRVHLSGLGYGIVNDRYYPVLLPEDKPDFSKPLQLLSRSITFIDPITKKKMTFTSSRNLMAFYG